ncbi:MULTISPECIES: hypothetical protein [unclassified Methanoregula]|nr:MULTISPECIES: hypothetical protein [unclassified Methanoregula]OPX64662.1 MAG: hypothetical protein A4E33_00746 [Methanoregula sp. PtaB.Bin085]OPY36030.1 MAG: hypothetical protein A4E34_00434 [Methanoregula sp. PtaU1.Bin006]
MPRKRNRFTLDDDGIVITGRQVPTKEDQEEADRVFDRILKNRKRA